MGIIEQYGHGLEIPKDELTAIERDRLLSEGKEVDRIMCCIDTGETLAPMIGLKVKDYYFSSEKMLELEQYIYDTFHSDGAETPALASLDDVDQAKLVDVDKDGRLPIILKGLKMVKENLGDKVPVSGTVTGPFTIAAMVVGTEKLLIGMIKKPDKVKQLMEVITENNERYIARMLEMGVGVGFADPVSTTSLLRVKQYREFSLPYFQHNVDFIKKNGGGCGLHICGGSRKLWEDLNNTGIGCFGLDNIEDLEEAKKVLGPHMAIQGNVPPVDVIRLGTPQDVLKSSKECIRKAWDSPNGFTLTSGCQTPMDTPAENLQALMDAARIFGRHPIDVDLLNADL